MGYAADLGIPSPRVELLPFKGPKDMVFLGHFAKGSLEDDLFCCFFIVFLLLCFVDLV